MADIEADIQGRLAEITIEDIKSNPLQPRTHFDDDTFEDLKHSIAQVGLTTPVLVRPDPSGGYVMVAGERRWRACRELGYTTIHAKIVDVDDEGAFVRSLEENLKRDNLSPFEEADAYKRLQTEFQWTQERIAEHYSKKPQNVTAAMRVAELPKKIRTEWEALENKPSKALMTEMAAKSGKLRTQLWEKIKNGEIRTVRQLREFVGETVEEAPAAKQTRSKKPLKPSEVIYHCRKFASGLGNVGIEQLTAELRGKTKRSAALLPELEYLIEHAQQLLRAIQQLKEEEAAAAEEEVPEDTVAAVEAGEGDEEILGPTEPRMPA